MQMANIYMKMLSITSHQENTRKKWQWDIISCQLQWQLFLKNPKIANASENVKERETNFLHCWWECKLVQPLWKTVWRFLKKLKTDLPYGYPTFGNISKGNLVSMWKKYLHCHVYCSLFTITKIWNQPYLVDWMKKRWYIYTMEYYSATKQNEILTFATKCMVLGTIMLRQISQTQTNTVCFLSSVEIYICVWIPYYLVYRYLQMLSSLSYILYIIIYPFVLISWSFSWVPCYVILIYPPCFQKMYVCIWMYYIHMKEIW